MTTLACPHCGQPHPVEATFCPNTGRPIPRQRSNYWFIVLAVVGLVLLSGGGVLLFGGVFAPPQPDFLVGPLPSPTTLILLATTGTPTQASALAATPASPPPATSRASPLSTPTSGPSVTTATAAPQVSVIDGMVQMYVPAGEFLLGASSDDIARLLLLCPSCDPASLRDQSPQRRIYLESYWIDRTEVTNAQFAQFVAQTGYVTTAEQMRKSYVLDPRTGEFRYLDGADWRHPRGPASDIRGRDQYPVTQISWDDAVAYCAWAGRRLPTEAEWEKAARGTDGRLFPWGNELPDERLLNFNVNIGDVVPVGSYPEGASPYGALDMAGSLWEWVADYYSETYYGEALDRNPTGPSTGEGHTFRGGSWASEAQTELVYVTTTFRLWNFPYIRSDVLGFRCATSEP